MTQALSALAITLKTQVHQERHQIITALTPQQGKIKAIARNSIQSRRFGASLQPFTAAMWRMSPPKGGSEFYHLQSADFKHAYQNIAFDLTRLSLASAMNEFLLRVAQPEQSSEKLFQLHCNALHAAESLPVNLKSNHQHTIYLLNVYLLKLTQWLGTQPRLQSCIYCQSKIEQFDTQTQLAAQIEEGGWLCPDCRQQGKLKSNSFKQVYFSADTIVAYLLCLQAPIKQAISIISATLKNHNNLPEDENQNLFYFFEQFLAFHVPGFEHLPIKSLRFLKIHQHFRNFNADSKSIERRPIKNHLQNLPLQT